MNDKGAQVLQLKARQLKAVRGDAYFFFSLRMALKPLPVLAAISRKPPFCKLKKLA